MGKSIMIQGTMSNVGKSLVTAGLLRILKQDGYKVAPFKSQNMALNSFITKEGLEMGRAQVMQAEASMIEPSVLMNPILLKPTTDVGSQVIVNGEVRGNMKAVDYFKYKKSLIPEIMEAYHKLEAVYDIIVIEGAGSPAEINLKKDDIVNMGLAKLTKSPVLMVGDIDRGGVFAQLAGTLMLLEEEERRMVKASIINKFRGDVSILRPGLTMLEDITNKPIAGVIPYTYLDIDDEDSLSERFHGKKGKGPINVSVVKFPKISNFTDFNPLETIDEITLTYATTPYELRNADLIILPGTKRTMSDLLWMRQNGMEAEIKKLAAKGKIIIGICGGFQMLSEELKDPYLVETYEQMKGMGLLNTITIFEKNKVRTQVKGIINPMTGIFGELSGISFEGYEIHMGNTLVLDGEKLDRVAGLNYIDQAQEINKEDGYIRDNILGTYVHGIFDNEEFLSGIIKILLKMKGMPTENVKILNFKEHKESQYNLLADTMRESLDMELIYKILEEGI
jgi:adenosylcobyric acid synthase